MEHLSFEKFEVLFHLLTGYYLLLGTFYEKFSYYFDFPETLVRYNQDVNNIDIQKNIDLLKTLRQKADKDYKNKLFKLLYDFRQRVEVFWQSSKYEKTINQHIKRLETAKTTIRKKYRSILSHSTENSKQSLFFKFFKFYYAITGCFCVTILLLNGFIEEWHRFINLEFLNISQLIVTLYVLIRISANRISNRFMWLSNWNIMMGFSFIFMVVVIIPAKWLTKFTFFKFAHLGELNFDDFQILAAVFLAFIPIIIHNISAYAINRHCKKVLFSISVTNNFIAQSKMVQKQPEAIQILPE